MQFNYRKMKTSCGYLFSLLIIGVFTQVKCQENFQAFLTENAIQFIQQDTSQLNNWFTTNALKYFTQNIGHSVSKRLKDIRAGYRLQVIEEANHELKMLKRKGDLCSLNKSKKIKAVKDRLLSSSNSSCLNLGESFSNVTSLINDTIRTTMLFVYDLGNFSMSIANCTFGDNKIQCLLNTTQALEDDINDVVPEEGVLITRLISLILDIIKSILECFTKRQSLQTKLEHYIQLKCRDHQLLLT